MNKLFKFLAVSAISTMIALPCLAADTPAADVKGPNPALTVTQPEGSVVTAQAAATAPAAPSADAAATATPAPKAPATGLGPRREKTFKVGIVDLAKIAADSKAGKAASASLKSRSGKLKSKIEARQKQLEKEKNAIQAQLPMMSPQAREAKAKEFQKKLEDFQKLLRSSDEELQREEAKLTEEVYKEIKKTANSYGKANGFAAIVERKGLLFMETEVNNTDLTDVITAAMNKKK